MYPMLFAIAALAAIVPASSLAASLSKVGGVFQSHRLPENSWMRCELADGTLLFVERAPLYDPIGSIFLHHVDANGQALASPLLVAEGRVSWGEIACGENGSAIVHWQIQEPPLTLYRLIGSDHQTAGDVHAIPPRGEQPNYFKFGLGQAGFAITWREPWNTPSSVFVQSFSLDGAPLFDPVAISINAEIYKSQPFVSLDSASNALVVWNETDWQVGSNVAVAVDVEGRTSGVPLVVVQGISDETDSAPYAEAAGPGRFVVSWHGRAAGGPLSQRVHIEGVVQTTTTTTSSTTTTLEDDPTPKFGPENDIGSVSDGSWLGLDLVGDGDESWVALQYGSILAVSSDGGRRWTKPQPRGAQYAPQVIDVASDGTGEWIAIETDWSRLDGEDDRKALFVSRSSSNGTVWSPASQVVTLPTISADECHQIWDYFSDGVMKRNADGSMIFVWHQSTDYHCEVGSRMAFRLFQIRSIDNGATWSSPELIDDDYESLAGYHTPRLEDAGDGIWLLVIGDWSHPRMLRSIDDGVTWSELTRPGFQWDTDIACDDDRNCLAVFTGVQVPLADADVWASRSSDAGSTWTAPILIDRGASSDAAADGFPSVATDGQGLWTVIWSSHRNLAGRTGFDADVLEASSADGGATWTPARTLNRNTATDDEWVNDLEVGLGYGKGSWVAVWAATSGANDGYGPVVPRVAIANPSFGDGVLDDGEECDDGNFIDGDGCDANGYFTACGNGRVTAGEECDDGNPFDNDSCTSGCTNARCGDGAVRDDAGHGEECDDGNTDPGDSCTNSCFASRCGDGVVSRDSEQCDDANSSLADACLPGCRLATCGDGYVHSGVEECDDGNTFTTDRCPADCRVATCGDGHLWLGVEFCEPSDPDPVVGCPDHCGVTLCGDVNVDGSRTATDSLTILAHSVGRPNHCPREQCDVDASRTIDTRDSLITLGVAVGRPYVTNCDLGPWMTLRLEDERGFGALQIEVDFDDAPLWMPIRHGNTPYCESLVPKSLSAAARVGSTLNLGIITSEEVVGPVDVARCRVDLYGEVLPDQLRVTVVEAADRMSNSLQPFPVVSARTSTE